RVAASENDWAASASSFTLAGEMARMVDDPPTHVETLTHRAIVHLRMKDQAAALADLAGARSQLSRVRVHEFRRLLEVNINSVDAMMEPNRSRAIAQLTDAIDFHRTNGRRMYLPELFMLRGRAQLASGDSAAAGADFESGVAELESRRET